MDFFVSKEKKYWNAVFSNCDFQFAADLLVNTFAGGIIQKDLASLLSAYTNNPCRETAIKLIEFNNDKFLDFFFDNKEMLEMLMRTRKLNREELSKTLRKNKDLLYQEPEFQAYCDALLKNDLDKIEAIMKKEKTALIQKGYSEEMISEAFAEYMANECGPIDF